MESRFNEAEINDFNALIERYRQDYPKDPNIPGLLVLGAFLLGLYTWSPTGPTVKLSPISAKHSSRLGLTTLERNPQLLKSVDSYEAQC